jgi:hypothetical protein
MVLVAGMSTWLHAQDLESIPSDKVRLFAEKLAEEAGKIDGLKIKIQADASQANGVHVKDMLGIIVVPQKDIKKGEESSVNFKAEKGVPFAYLFSYKVVPILDGKPVQADQLYTLKVSDNNGEERKVHVLPLTAKKLSDDDYRLQAYGCGDKPVVDAKFSSGDEVSSPPVKIEIEDADSGTYEGTVKVTVFGKYQASFRAAYVE